MSRLNHINKFIKYHLDINEADQKDPENKIKIQNINPLIVEDF